MTHSSLKHLRLLAPLTAAAALSLGSLPAMAQSATDSNACSSIRFDIGNPAPGSRLEIGNLVVAGVARDVRASQGLGISSVDFFLDSRDQGGVSLGSVVPGAMAGPAGYGSFQITLNIPKMVGGHDFYAYAHSTVSNTDVVVAIPVAVGEDPSKISLTADATSTTTCRVGGTIISSSTAGAPAPTQRAPVVTTVTSSPGSAATSASTVVLNVANPSPGSSIKSGKLSVQGDATDRAATSATGIDRIDIFLDNPDTGGSMLSTATLGPGTAWQAFITLPSNHLGQHNLYFIAHSSLSAATTTVVVPVTITS